MHWISSRVSDVFRWRREAGHLLPGTVAAVLGLLFSVLIFLMMSHWEAQLAEQQLATRASSQRLNLQNGIDEYIADVVALRALFESSSHTIIRREFTAFTESLLRDNPAILTVSWTPRVTQNDREAHELAAPRDGIAHYRIKSL